MDSETRMTGPVRVEDVTTSKKGTSYRVRLGDNWYGSDMKSGINDALGKMIVADISSDFGGWIKRWKMASDQTLPAGARPVTPHQGATGMGSSNDLPKVQWAAQEKVIASQSSSPGAVPEPARQLSAEELKVVNGIVMALIEHGNIFDERDDASARADVVSVCMKAIATTVREL